MTEKEIEESLEEIRKPLDVVDCECCEEAQSKISKALDIITTYQRRVRSLSSVIGFERMTRGK